jgi:hypothetical protein
MPFERLPESVQTLYAELLDQARGDDVAPGSGSFVSKEIRGARYWYVQRLEAGRKRQLYLGRETPELLERIRSAQEQREERTADERQRRELVAMLVAGGAARESAAVIQVLGILVQAGVFRHGGVLVGTQAFTCYANVLGVRFEAQSLRTADIDIAQPSIAVGDLRAATTMLQELRGADAHFVEVPSFNPGDPSSSFRVRGRDLRVDFLTPAVRGRTRPVYLPHLGAAADPVAGLDYLLGDVVPAVVIGASGVLVRVPAPARFALHKLWVARQRPVSEQTKARKDLRQAEQLLDVLLEDRPEDIVRGWEALAERAGMRRVVKSGLSKLSGDLESRVLRLLAS